MSFINPGKTLVCINSFQPFGFGAVKPGGPPNVYDHDPFQNGGNDAAVMPDSRLAYIRSSGFECIRMVVDIAALMAADTDEELDRLISQLATGISRRIAANLKVIVDIHPLQKGGHRVAGWSDSDIVDGPKGPKFQRLMQVASRLAKAVSAFDPNDVAFELFNEPPPVTEFVWKTPWNVQIERYWREVRRVLPNHLIIVAGTNWAGIDGLSTGSPAAGITDLRPGQFDLNTAYAFHPYEPVIFTQQGFGFFSHVHGLAFPAADHSAGRKKAEQDFVAAVKNDGKLSSSQKKEQIQNFIRIHRHSYSFYRYWKEFGTIGFVYRRLKVVTDWADKHGLDHKQIVNTEFGVNYDHESCDGVAPRQSAMKFIKAIRESSVKAGIGLITLHQVQGDCFAISQSAAHFEFDGEILSALGLNKNE